MNLKKQILSLLILFWVFLAFFGVAYNAFKIIKEYKQLGNLSDIQKRKLIFGDKYTFIMFVDKNTDKENNIYLFSDDAMTYYLARYYLYPKRVYWIKDNNELSQLSTQKPKFYIVSNQENKMLNNLVPIATSSSSKNVIYIKK